MKLNLGCGADIKKGYVNIDFRKLTGVDVKHDLNKFPYPFKNNTFDFIYSRNCIEQLDDIMKVMYELHRICKKKGLVNIIVYHFSSSMAFYCRHKIFFNIGSMYIFRDKFDIFDVRIVLSDKKNFIINLLERWINNHKLLYEKTFIKSLIPAYVISFSMSKN